MSEGLVASAKQKQLTCVMEASYVTATTLKTTATHYVFADMFRGIGLRLDDNQIRNVIVFLKSFFNTDFS